MAPLIPRCSVSGYLKYRLKVRSLFFTVLDTLNISFSRSKRFATSFWHLLSDGLLAYASSGAELICLQSFKIFSLGDSCLMPLSIQVIHYIFVAFLQHIIVTKFLF